MARKLKTDTNTGATAVAPRNTQSAEDRLKPQGDQAQARTSAPAAVTLQSHTGGRRARRPPRDQFRCGTDGRGW